MESSINTVVTYISESSMCIALTGAGISTDSGIPDFRSPHGIWNKYPVLQGDVTSFMQNPDQFFELGKELYPKLKNAHPNKGHISLKKLEDMGHLQCIITQNIDGLHQKAGSKNVIELHGTYATSTCLTCGTQYDTDEFMPLSGMPRCPHCSGIVKPDVIMFGESLPQKAFSKAVSLSQKADVMVVIGSSLQVTPASRLVFVTKQNNGKIIIINNTKTVLHSAADISIQKEISHVLPVIVSKLQEGT
ncbi:MAG: Sir2 family NAD-dependent protein deacetylase [Candidatus Methanofastidiosia archaeon]